MREIKFRAFDNIDKKMYPYAIPGFNGELHVHKNAEHNGEWINIGCGREDGEVDYSNELLQYLGLKDKNGKEIYEGDIFSENDVIGTVETDNFGVTCFREKNSVFVIDIIDAVSQSLVSSDGKIKNIAIIGNIYENPELLTK